MGISKAALAVLLIILPKKILMVTIINTIESRSLVLLNGDVSCDRVSFRVLVRGVLGTLGKRHACRLTSEQSVERLLLPHLASSWSLSTNEDAGPVMSLNA